MQSSNRLIFCLLLAVFVAGCANKGARTDDARADGKAMMVSSEGVDVSPEILEKFEEAMVAFEWGELDRGEQLLTEIQQERPDLSGPYANLALIAEARHDYERAESLLKKALEINPDNVHVYGSLAVVYRKQGRFDEAVAMYEKALEVDGGYANAHNNLGVIYDLYLAAPEKALSHFEKYQEMTSGKDKEVDRWIVEIKRRLQ